MDDTFGLPTETELTSDDIPIAEDVEEKDAADKVFDFLGKTGFLELIEDSEEFDTWLKNTPNEKLFRYTTVLNKILTGEHYNDKKIPTGANGITSYIDSIVLLAPTFESKIPLFYKSLDVIKKLDNNQDRALLTYYTLQNLHLYKDGNGRTGRLLFTLLNAVGQDLKVEDIRDITIHSIEQEQTGRGIFANKVLPPQKANYFINRELLKDLIGKELPNIKSCITNLPPKNTPVYYDHPIRLRKYRQLVSRDVLEKTGMILEETGDIQHIENRSLVLLELINRYPDLQRFKHLTEKNSVLKINAERLLKSNLLKPKRLSSIIEIHKEFKEKQTEKLLDIFQYLQKYTTTNKKGKEVPIKSRFLKK